MADDKGIRALLPGVVFPHEEQEKQDVREYIRKNIQKNILIFW